jgi:hypothetical protein
MRRHGKLGLVILSTLLAGAVGLGTALGSTTTSVQDNGFACLADSRNPSAPMWRNGAGLQNTGSSAMGIYCPMTMASGDSYVPGSHQVISAEVFYTGSAPTSCTLRFRSTTGSVMISPTLVAGTSATAGVPVRKLASLFKTSFLSPALGLRCSLHTGFVPDVTGGI